ncbi:DUF1631 family protein [Azonexus sp.]|uniref:DUF1631 family protein n=1 Tax=Azonexus sp. TaxID=1872668 RepID=UPI00281D7C9B|nr:DUF1631 family protein [Azonexus sp.]MDR1995510.1 DUF1631 domain-containing protein [Azonexus sp.]
MLPLPTAVRLAADRLAAAFPPECEAQPAGNRYLDRHPTVLTSPTLPIMPAPDRFEITRDCRAYYLERLGWLLRSGGLLSEKACQALLDGVGKHYDEIVNNPQRGSFSEEARGLTSSRITLIADDELELGILLDHVTSRLFEEGATGELWKTQQRFMTLLGRLDMQRGDNPVGPRGISEGLRAMFAAADASSLDQKQNLIDCLENQLREGLPWVYGEVCNFLDQAGVATIQPGIVKPPESPRDHRDTVVRSTENAPQTLHTGLLARQSSNRDSTAASSYGASTLLSQAAIDNLLFRLEAFEQPTIVEDDFLSSNAPALEALLPGLFADQPAPVAAAPRRPLNSHELRVSPTTAEGLAIDSAAMICQTIAAAPELPEVLKTLVASLEVSIVRIAIKDASLFANAEHPCRRFINALGRAVLGLPLDVSAQHPLCQRLTAIVKTLRQDRSGGTASYVAALRELRVAIDERETAIDRAAAAYLPLFAQLDRRDQADHEVNALFARLGVEREPAEIRSFLERIWRHLLARIWLHDGPDSPAWQQHVQALDTLLWSFQPKLELADRKRMAQKLPGVLQVINVGMERMKMSPDDRTRVLDACLSRQREALRQTTAEPQPVAPVPPAKRPLPPVTTNILKAGTLVLHTLDLAAADLAQAPQPPCQPGDWLELPVAGQRCALRVCRQSRRSGRSLLLNPDLDLALAIHPQLLKQQLSAGEAIRLGQSNLFEAAATQALCESGIRGSAE